MMLDRVRCIIRGKAISENGACWKSRSEKWWLLYLRMIYNLLTKGLANSVEEIAAMVQ